MERQLGLEAIEDRTRRLALGCKVYRLGKIGMYDGELLFGESEAAVGCCGAFGTFGREPGQIFF